MPISPYVPGPYSKLAGRIIQSTGTTSSILRAPISPHLSLSGDQKNHSEDIFQLNSIFLSSSF